MHITSPCGFRPFIAIVLLAVLGSLTTSIGQVKFYAEVSESKVFANQTFQVQYTIEGAKRIQQFKYPEFEDFTIEEFFEIPNTPKINSQNLQLVDSYSKVAVLSPKREGRFSIKAASAIIDGKLLKSNMVRVLVQGNSQGASYNQGITDRVEDESEILPGQTIANKIKENFFLTSEVNKTTCYVGEPLMAVYKACSRLNANSQVVKRPSLTGFSVIEMVDAYDAQPEVETIRGKPFYVHLIRKVQLFPLQPGNYQLEGAEVESVIQFVKREQPATAEEEPQRLLNRQSGNVSYKLIQHQLSLNTVPLNVTVKALPDSGQPADFAGAVGNFTIETTVTDSDLEQGSAADVLITVKGTGNFPLLTAPEIKWPSNVEVSENGISEQTNRYNYPLAGSKTFSYRVSSKDIGTFQVPPVQFSYFNPAQNAYRTTSTEAVTINVSKNRKTLREVFSRVGKTSPGFPRQYYFFAVLVVGIVGWLVYQIFFAGRKARVAKPAGNNAPTAATTNPFEEVDNALALGDRKEFYGKLQDLLWKIAAEECGMRPSGLSKQNIAAHLRARNVSEDVIADFRMVLNECEWALYTPDSTASDMIAMRQKAEKLYDQLKSPG